MKTLRRLHLYLGTFFAPLLAFFAISGIWQLFFLHWDKDSKILSLLSTLHTSRGLKREIYGVQDLSSDPLRWFAAAMAAGLLLTILLGVALAWRSRQRKAVVISLAAGIAVPLTFVLIAYFR